MPLKFIKKTYTFSKPGSRSDSYTFDNEIVDQKATVVLRGINPSYGDEDNNLLKFRAQITNVKVVDKTISYNLEFDFSDDAGNTGSADFDILIVANVM